MTAPFDGFAAKVGRSIPATTVEGRLGRVVVATVVIGGYMTLGFAFGLSAEGYLLLGIPIAVAFQVLVVRRPLRALWLRGTPPMTLTPRSIAAVVAIAIAPAVVAMGGLRTGNPVLAAYGLAAIVGAVGAVYAIRAMDRDAVNWTIRTTLITGTILAVADVGRSAGFYAEQLGFAVEAIYDDPPYATLAREGVRLSLAEQAQQPDELHKQVHDLFLVDDQVFKTPEYGIHVVGNLRLIPFGHHGHQVSF